MLSKYSIRQYVSIFVNFFYGFNIIFVERCKQVDRQAKIMRVPVIAFLYIINLTQYTFITSDLVGYLNPVD